MDEPADILKNAEARGLRRALIVTALPLERDAVRAHFLEIGTCVGEDDRLYDCFEYRCGGNPNNAEAQGWLIVIAESGAGTHVAQSAVIHANQMFKPFELILLIGVAASRKKDIPIGSVIASDRIYYPHVGKYEEGSFRNRSRLHNVSETLKSLATWIIRENGWQARVRPIEGWTPPGDEKYAFLFTPIAKIAGVVTVEAVSADVASELEKNIEAHYQDAHALEMEGYGAALGAETVKTPIMVIRGISDMREGKNPEDDAVYQPVAAMHAAAFGVRLLDEWSDRNPRHPIDLKPMAQPMPLVAPPTAMPAERAVYNLDANLDDLSPEQLEGIVETLRRRTGNPNLKLVGLEKGSARLIVEGGDDPIQFDQTLLREALATEHALALKGTVSESDYRQIQILEKQLPGASAGVLTWPRTLPDGHWIDRPETETLLDRIHSEESSTTVLLGKPGSGKSALLADLAHRLGAEGWPVLAIKADLLPVATASDEDLGQALGLNAAVSEVILKIAALRPVVLVIDQLDALAGYVDLRTDRLNTLLNLVRRLDGFRNVHIILSAREFEFRHDVRLRTIQANELVLAVPPWEDVASVLAAHAVKADGWPADAKTMMLIPQALATFLRLLSASGSEPFPTYQSMLDTLWRLQVLAHPRGAQLDGLLSAIANQMADEEVLWLAEVRFDDRHDDVEVLKALGVLVEHRPGRIGFAHQTLFEHALARSFAREAGALSGFVLQRTGSLFIRPRLWAALGYLRGVEEHTYRRELETIWNQPTLRTHLRQLLVEFLGQQTRPLDFEELIMVQALQQKRTRSAALRAIGGSSGWFDRLAHSVIAPAMERPEEAGLTQFILFQAWAFAPERVIAMIKARWLPDPQFDSHLMSVIFDCPAWTDEVAEIAATVAQRSSLSPYILENMVATIGAEHPNYALSIVRAVLDRNLNAALEESARRLSLTPPAEEQSEAGIVWHIHNSPSDPLRRLVEDDREWDSLEALAELHPLVVLEQLWPWMKRVIGGLAELDRGQRWSPGFPLTYSLDFRFAEENSFDLPEPTLLGALRVATETLANRDPDEALAWLAKEQDLAAEPAQRLFAHVLASQPERFSTAAWEFLTADPNRLHIGNIEDLSSTAKRLIAVVSPYWSADQLRGFEKYVFGHGPDYTGKGTPPPKSRRAVNSIIRQTKLGLLRALPQDRVSEDARRFIREEERVFGSRRVGTTYSGVHAIGSPISADELARADDQHIVRAFEGIPDATGWNHPSRWMTGGNIQLAREFAAFARGAPDRAASVLRFLVPETGTRAAGYALEAMAEAADPELVCAVLRDAVTRGFDGEEFRGSSASAMVRLANRDFVVPEDIVSILESWLVVPAIEREADAEAEVETREIADQDPGIEVDEDPVDKDSNRSILWDSYGMAMLPHGNYPILDCLMTIYLKAENPEGLLDLFERHLTANEPTSIWQPLVYRLVFVRPHDPHRLADFVRALFARYPDIAGTREAGFFLGHLHWPQPDLVRELLLPCRDARKPRLQQYFGELVSLVALVQPDQQWARKALQELLTTNAPRAALHGAIESAVHVWKEEAPRADATTWLVAAIPLLDERGWEIVFDLFRLVDPLQPGPTTSALLGAIADHLPDDVGADPTFLVPALAGLLPHNADLVAVIAGRLVQAQRSRLTDLRTSHSAVVPELVDLAITLHRSGEASREAGIVLFEQLVELDSHLARQTFDEIDNRFRDAVDVRRPRLPRRSQRRAARRTPRRSVSI